MVIGALATVLLATAVPTDHRGLPGDLLVASPGHSGPAGAIVDQATPQRSEPAPAAVLQEGDRLMWRPRTAKAGPLPLDLEMEMWQGTLCVKGAWTLRASRSPDEPLGDVGKRPLWQMQVSPALLADGSRLMPGIGASTRF
jgi:hypothetical protein